MPNPLWSSGVVNVGGLECGYLEAGSGANLVLLHSGEFGASAENSWHAVMPTLAQRFRVVAPDWLGYGASAKVHDFENITRRRLIHLRDALQRLDVADAHFVGTSVGGTMLLHAMTRRVVPLPIRSATLISSGGPMPDSAERRVLLDYDGTLEGMRSIIRVMFHDPAWARDDDFVRARWNESQRPGAWQSIAAARFPSPFQPPSSDFGRPDTFAYEEIDVPVLVIGGANDKLKPPGYMDTFVPRIPRAESLLIPRCGHCPALEHPEVVASAILEFLSKSKVEV